MSAPSSELGHPTPSPASECVSPFGPKERRNSTALRVRGRGTQFGRLERKPGTLYTLLYMYILHYIEYEYITFNKRIDNVRTISVTVLLSISINKCIVFPVKE